jgi:hypothetical protein
MATNLTSKLARGSASVLVLTGLAIGLLGQHSAAQASESTCRTFLGVGQFGKVANGTFLQGQLDSNYFQHVLIPEKGSTEYVCKSGSWIVVPQLPALPGTRMEIR